MLLVYGSVFGWDIKLLSRSLAIWRGPKLIMKNDLLPICFLEKALMINHELTPYYYFDRIVVVFTQRTDFHTDPIASNTLSNHKTVNLPMNFLLQYMQPRVIYYELLM